MRLLGAAVALLVCASTTFAQPRIASRYGEANVGNRKAIVHVTVAVPPGLDANEVAENAVRGQGARPLDSAELTLNGLRWPTDSPGSTSVTLPQNYSPAGQVTTAAQNELLAAQQTWTDVGASAFAFQSGGVTARCPSLVRECPGAQLFDGYNDVGWAAISGCCTLGVTWYSTSGPPEADMALNTRFPWSTTGNGGYDLQTVYLHENGHVLGLGHSTVSGSIMEATYAGVRQDLAVDDILGLTYLYPETSAVGDISGTVKSQAGANIPGAQITVSSIPVSAVTDAAGTYTLAGLPNSISYSVTASATGYKSVTIQSVRPTASEIDFALPPLQCKGKKCQ